MIISWSKGAPFLEMHLVFSYIMSLDPVNSAGKITELKGG
jgi:hypothetical protein